jgi:SnoaL-like domain
VQKEMTNMRDGNEQKRDQYRATRRDFMTGFVATALSMGLTSGAGVIHNQSSSEGNVHMDQIIETLLRENLHGVFGEHDALKRRKNIARLWAEDCIFVDHTSRYEGHSGVERAAAGLGEKFPDFVFTERGIQAFNGVGKLDWGFGPAGGKTAVTGIDVLVMKGDKIGAIYTFVDPPRK